MTDLEMTKLCAEAMGLRQMMSPELGHFVHLVGDFKLNADGRTGGFPVHKYDPLHDDAQAMALVKKLGISIRQTDPDMWDAWIPLQPVDGSNADLNRAIVECAAKIASR